MTHADELIGRQIDQYLVERHLASGGMAGVYLARDTRLQRPVALKVMLPEIARRPELVERFYREARAAATLDHPNIVNVYTIGAVPGADRPYLAMQYVDGGSLGAHLGRPAGRGRRMAPDEVLALLHPIAKALGVAHRAGIVHRDLKPSNILLRADGTPLLTDLGIAAVKTATTRLTRTGMVLGTPHYMSPEQAGGTVEVDGRSDIYSLGVILYEMLAGTVPFDGDNSLAILHQHLYEPPPPLVETRPGLARATYRLVDVCLSKDPAERFGDAARLAAAMEEALAVERGERPDTPLADARPTEEDGGRRFAWPYAAGGGIVLVLGLLAFIFWPGGGERGYSHFTARYRRRNR